jgi:hypothetical protein
MVLPEQVYAGVQDGAAVTVTVIEAYEAQLGYASVVAIA